MLKLPFIYTIKNVLTLYFKIHALTDQFDLTVNVFSCLQILIYTQHIETKLLFPIY